MTTINPVIVMLFFMAMFTGSSDAQVANRYDIVIDEFGNLNWRKSFTISEEENKDKAGEWIYKIEAVKATGFFKISLQTY